MGAGLYRPEFEHDACGIGALAHLKGKRSHSMVDDALSVLVNLEHRGGKGLEPNTGDGAGILFQVPHRFFRKEAQKCGHLLPSEGDYGIAMIFCPQDEVGVRDARRIFEDGCAAEGVPVLFWREVPVDDHDLGATARACMPTILQAFVSRPEHVAAGDEFERKLYVCRRTIEKRAEAAHELGGKIFYVCSMSSRTIVYKGMLVATQMRRFYLDLNDAAVESSLALVHSRYSTNTTPSWERAHPNRLIIHNGEINTLRGNVNWLRAREPHLYSPVLGPDIQKVLPVISKEGSDSAILDNVLEFLVMNGRDMARSMTLMIPEPWERQEQLTNARRSYDEYQSMLMEPWDGPAAIAFSDGVHMGAILDRNGLRPARYYVTRDDRLILSSEVGVMDMDPAIIMQAGCLGPGEMLLVDPAQGRVLYNDELRDGYASQKPFYSWLKAEAIDVSDLDAPQGKASAEDARMSLTRRLACHGYHFDDIWEVVQPMAQTGEVPLASMGADVAPAVLSRRPRSFFDYFNELFAQVTNPPIDALRESLVTSDVLYLGNHGNLLEDSRDTCRVVRLAGPILSAEDFDKICCMRRVGFRVERFRAVYSAHGGPKALERVLDDLDRKVEAVVRGGANIVVISDRSAEGEVPIPSLLSLGSVHNHLVRSGVRMRADLVVETGDAVSPHDFATLVGYSATGIHPYLAHDCIGHLVKTGALALGAQEAMANYDRAVTAGIMSIMSKMGISAMQSYHSAQIFEILGLSDDLVSRCFAGTTSRIGGLDLEGVKREIDERYSLACTLDDSAMPSRLASSGITKWRPGSEEHLITPQAIYLLQRACREGSYELFEKHCKAMRQPGRTVVLRDLLDRGRAAAVAGRWVRWVLHNVLHRHASQLPGRVALAMDPEFIASRRDAIGRGSIVVCGTNGKTTTTNLVAAAITASGQRVLCNYDGANMEAGVASALLGKGPADWVVLEVDELSTIHVVPRLQPTYLVLLNLFRDQLDRAGEIDHVQDVIVQALAASPATTLVCCGEDPLCMGVAVRARAAGTKVVTFGVGQDLGLAPERVPEARFCQACGQELRYAYRTYAQLGGFACPACGFSTPPLDFLATDARASHDGVSFELVRGNQAATSRAGARLRSNLGGAYMVYNLLAAASAASLAGANATALQTAIDSYAPSNGRMQHFVVQGREVVLNLAKNPTGLNQSLLLCASDPRPKALLVIINDDYNDGRDISWIWDVDFERLAGDKSVGLVMAGGHRANDLQVRLKYAEMSAPIAQDVAQALQAVASMPATCPLYVCTNYSALWPTKAELERMAMRHE